MGSGERDRYLAFLHEGLLYPAFLAVLLYEFLKRLFLPVYNWLNNLLIGVPVGPEEVSFTWLWFFFRPFVRAVFLLLFFAAACPDRGPQKIWNRYVHVERD